MGCIFGLWCFWILWLVGVVGLIGLVFVVNLVTLIVWVLVLGGIIALWFCYLCSFDVWWFSWLGFWCLVDVLGLGVCSLCLGWFG